MTDTKKILPSDNWHDAEERASWLLKINGGRVVVDLVEYTDVMELAQKIVDREKALVEAGETSMFERKNVIPNKDLPIEE